MKATRRCCVSVTDTLTRCQLRLPIRQWSPGAAWKRYWWAMDESLFSAQRREGCLNSICELLEGWIRYYEKLDSTVSENGMSSATP